MNGWIFAVFSILIIILILYMNKQNKKHQELINKLFEEEEEKNENERKKLGLKKPTRTIEHPGYDKYNLCVKVYQKLETLEINNVHYKFCDILDYEVSKLSNGDKIIATSTASALKRAVTGGLIFGSVGAIAGAVTAKKIIKENENIYYRIILTINDLKEPLAYIFTEHEYIAKEVCAVLNIILSKQTK